MLLKVIMPVVAPAKLGDTCDLHYTLLSDRSDAVSIIVDLRRQEARL
jgi:hypothetical protein